MAQTRSKDVCLVLRVQVSRSIVDVTSRCLVLRSGDGVFQRLRWCKPTLVPRILSPRGAAFGTSALVARDSRTKSSRAQMTSDVGECEVRCRGGLRRREHTSERRVAMEPLEGRARSLADTWPCVGLSSLDLFAPLALMAREGGARRQGPVCSMAPSGARSPAMAPARAACCCALAATCVRADWPAFSATNCYTGHSAGM